VGGGGGGDRMAGFAQMNSSVSGVREMDDGGGLDRRGKNQLREVQLLHWCSE
jgi:hypothetical protein